ncbi:uncharacterized protein LOC119181403 [Rhipicephalus microplus]|uniref:uncharacterized protein LOC119181403 n=1 Tax=Rhipicephalus microplus TaxID=6941 RepID=UPI003F6AA5CD
MFSASKDLSAMGRGAAQASASGNDYRVVLPRLPTGKLVVDSVFLHADLAGRPYRVQDFRDTPRDIIDLKEISSIGQFQMSHVWMVTCKLTLTKTKLVTRGEFFVKSRRCLVIEPEPTEVKLKLKWLPERLEDTYVCEALQAFGKVKTISQESWKVADMEQMRTLNRDVVLSLADGVRNADIPHILVVCGVQSLVLIPGRPPLCLRCSKVGHIRRNCRTPRCDNCRRFGHSAEDCAMTYANKLRQHTKQPDDNLKEHIMDATEVLDATGDTPSMSYAAGSTTRNPEEERKSLATNSKSNQRLAIDRLVQAQRSSGVTDTTLLKDLAERYLPLGPSGDWDYPVYQGRPLQEIDSPFTNLEIEEVLHALNSRAAPGPDGVTNKLLRNLDGKSIAKLTEEVNILWAEGRVPETWRTASVILIPKPGKVLAMENIRPISLTSCVGKVMKHVVHNRVSRYIENKELFPCNMLCPSIIMLARLQIHNRKMAPVSTEAMEDDEAETKKLRLE